MKNLDKREFFLSHYNQRPQGIAIDTIVIHSIFAKDFQDKFSIKNCLQILDHNKVSAHYLIAQNGQIIYVVREDKRAWHAGISQLPFANDKRENVNDFSIGIELIADLDIGYTDAQYSQLAALITEISCRHSIRYVIGHEHIAPERKNDPGPKFSWTTLSNLYAAQKIQGSVVPKFIG